jgi:dipeptidyl aminopeptidase/acylaminoacyl peptidase
MIFLNTRKPRSILLAALLACSTAAWSEDHQGSVTLSLEETVSLKQVTKAVISPNADAIAYLLSVPRTLYKDENGAAWRQLHVVDLDGKSRPYFSGQVDVSDVHWSADGRELFFLGKRDVSADYPNIYRIPLDGGEAEVIFEGKAGIKSISPSPRGDSIAFLASEPKPKEEKTLAEKGFKALVYEESARPTRVWLLDIESGEAVAQDLAGSASAFDWSPDGKFYAVALAPTALIDDEYMSRDIFVIETAGASIRNQMGVIGKLGAFKWSPDGRQIAWIGAEDIHDPQSGRLYAASSQGGERRDLLPGYAGHVTSFFWHDGGHVEWNGARGLWTEQGRVSLRDIQPAGDAPASGPIIRHIDGHAGQQLAAAVADSPSHPQEVYLLRQGAEPARLTHSNPVLEQRKLARQDVIRYRARDGLELEAIVIHPADSPPRGGSPLVMMIHGGPESHYSNGWMSNYGRPAQSLAAQGFLVVYPNYRGSTGRGVEFSKMSQHDYAAAEFDDIVDAKQHLVEQGLADSERTGITGGSYGGYASMWAASALSEHFAAAVAFVGISDQISKFGTTDIPKEMYNVHARAWPWDDWMWMLQRSPVFHADKVRTPLLIMHGDKDPRVHPSQSLEMYRYVKVRTDTPVRLVYYPGAGHGNRNTAARYDYALRLERWMNHYLQGPGGQAPPYEIDHASRLDKTDGEENAQSPE